MCRNATTEPAKYSTALWSRVSNGGEEVEGGMKGGREGRRKGGEDGQRGEREEEWGMQGVDGESEN